MSSPRYGTDYSVHPLTVEEMASIRAALIHALAEIHNPGAARASRIDVLGRIEDALYQLTDAIERKAEA